MPVVERVTLYALAIQSGLRSSELRSLTPGRLFLDSPTPNLTCKAGSTKNRTEARQYLKPEVAESLRRLAGSRKKGQPVFSLPPKWDMATMLRRDLEAARKAWLAEAEADTLEAERRQESDFLAVENHEGEALDFHALRHTCGAWLAKAGNHPKVVQTIMRHSTMTLTMDT
jgi:integrase